jgi:sugar transferase (PEP-CTERM/EpsH1 system associated)
MFGPAVTADAPPLICHVIHHLVVGGMENGLINLINHLPADRYRHAVLCIEGFSDFRQRIQRPDVDVIALDRSRNGVLEVRREIFRICRQRRPAVVHTRSLSGLDALLPAWLAGVRRRVHSEHGWDVDNLAGQAWKPALLRRLHSPLVDRYVVVSKDIERFLQQRIGIRPGRITQIYNGVDTERFVPAPPVGDIAWPPGFEGEGVLRFGTVGRMQPVKDHATLLRAIALLAARQPALRPRVRLVIVGDGPLLAATRDLAQTLGIADIVWLPGSSDRVPQWLRSIDVFVLPSLNEGISNTILEAMASGLPIVASRVGGNVELVAEGRTGQLVPPGNVEQLAGALERYTTDEALRREHGKATRRLALERFSLAAMVGSYQAVYDQMCGLVS